MSFNIPGYFLDQKTKKLFKIQSHGPFSLKELQKRVREEEQEAAAAASASGSGRNNSNGVNRTCKKVRSPTNLTQFLRHRAALGSVNNSLANNSTSSNSNTQSGLPFLLTQLKCRSKVDLGGQSVLYNNMRVDLTSDPEYGEMIFSYRSGRIARVGYQVNPGFQIWDAGQLLSTEADEVSSLHFGSQYYILNGEERRAVISTSGNNLCRFSFPKLPKLSTEDLRQQFVTATGSIRNDGHILGYPPLSYAEVPGSHLDNVYKKRKDLFLSSSIDENYGRVAVGGDQAFYLFTSNFELINSQKVNSSIFSTHLPKEESNLCWTGARNGIIKLIDFRQCNQQNISMVPTFEQSSSITQIQKLAGYELLSIGMDGSVNIWDIRQPKGSNKKRGYHGKGGYKQKYKQQTKRFPEPIRRLKGHVNEISQNLAFDVDLENNLLMLSGSDGRVRIWSIFDSNSNEPIWSSEKFSSPIPAAKFMLNDRQYPRVQDGWSDVLEEPTLLKNYPGILLFGAEHKNGSSIQWLTGVK